MSNTKILGFTITSKVIKTRIKKISKFEDIQYIAQMLIEMTTTFWKFKRVSQKWHNVRRYWQGVMWNTRIQDGFKFRSEAEDAIQREIERMEFKESSEYIRVNHE